MMRVLILSCLLGLPLVAEEALPISKDYWKDESFLKSFNGSYRINSRIEPTVGSAERGVLVKVEKEMVAGNRKSALALLEGNELTKSSAALLFNQGNLEFELGDLDKALVNYEKALKIYPSFRRAHRNLGMAFVRKGELGKALECLLESVRLGDQDGATMGMVGYCYLEKEQFGSALQAYRMARLTQPDVAEWKAGAARCLTAVDEDAEAEVLLVEALEDRPEAWDYYRLLANVRSKLGKIDEAMAGLEWVRREGHLGGADLVLLARLYLGQGDLNLGVGALKEAKTGVTSGVAKPYLMAIRDGIRSSDLLKVDGLLDGLDGLEGEELRMLRRVKARRGLMRGDDGIGEELKKLVSEDGLDGESLLMLADFYVKEKEVELAGMQYDRAARVEGSRFEALWTHGRMLVAEGRYKEALVKLDEALEVRTSVEMERYVGQVRRLVEAG